MSPPSKQARPRRLGRWGLAWGAAASLAGLAAAPAAGAAATKAAPAAGAAATKAAPGAPAVTAAPAGAPAAACARETALAHHAEGERLYKDGRYSDAVLRYAAAYGCRPAPEFLFNIAQAYRLLGDCGRAMKYYERFLAGKPDAPNRAAVESAVANCLEAVKEGKSRPYDVPGIEAALSGKTALVASATTGPGPAVSAVSVVTPAAPLPESPGGGARTALVVGLVLGGVAVVAAAGATAAMLLFYRPFNPDASIVAR